MKRLIAICLFVTLPALMWAQDKEKLLIHFGLQDKIHSEILKENRELNLYFPEGYYTTDTNIRYDVIYLLDGGLDEDFFHVAGLVQFSHFPWVNRLKNTIVVGIANTDRKRDMTFPALIKAHKDKHPTSGGSGNFMAFIEKELQPYIEKNYRVTKKRTLVGESLAGLFAAEVLLKKPELFDTYIIVSPSLWWDNGSLLEDKPKFNSTNPSKKTHIYIGVGKEGLTPSDPPRVMEVDANILADKIKAVGNKNVELYFDYLPEEDHATVGHQALLNAFKKLATAK